MRFLLVGVYNTVFSYVVFIGIYLLFNKKIHYLLVLLVTHVIGVSNAFFGHKYITFRSHGYWFKEFLRFNLTYLGALGLGLVGLPFLVEICRLNPITSQGLITVITVVSSYFLHKKISFRPT